MAPIQLVRRATGFFEGLHGAAGIAYMSTMWAGVTVAVCATAGSGVCIGSLVMTAVLSVAATVGFGLDITGSTAISAKRATLAGLALSNFTLTPMAYLEGNDNVNRTLSDAGLEFHGIHPVFLTTGKLMDKLLWRDNLVIEVIHFSSSFGHHAAVPFKKMSTDELASMIVEAIPGSISNSTNLKKRDFDATWLSYNYDNYNSDLSKKWYEDATENTPGEVSDIATSFDYFVLANEAWKYCFDVVSDEDNVEPTKTNMDSGKVGTAIHGEVYFNAYGGIDGQCNSFYDCDNFECSN